MDKLRLKILAEFENLDELFNEMPVAAKMELLVMKSKETYLLIKDEFSKFLND
ncbi:MAG: hypothetical protein ACEPO8_10155 [Rhodothermaceae bacterium]